MSPFRKVSGRTAARQRGVYGLMFALLLIPLIGVVGCAVDYARLVQYKSDLQNAVDEAALAGAAALTNTDASTNTAAVTLATNYFSRALLPVSLKINSPTVTADNSGNALLPGSTTNKAFTVQVSASATVGNTLFSLFVPSVSVSATGKAAEPLVSANLQLSNVNHQACDSNTLYVYQVPKTANGTGYDYSIAALNQLQSSDFTPVTSTTALQGVGANQPLGIALLNSTGTGTCSYGPNGYGAPVGSQQGFFSSLVTNGMAPSEDSTNTNIAVGNSNSTYPVYVTTTTTTSGHRTTSSVTQVTVTPQGASSPTSYTGTSLTYTNYTGNASCVATGQPSLSQGNTKSTQLYLCTTKYKTQGTNANTYKSNCSLYVQTGVTSTYVANLNSTSTAPAASSGTCSTITGGGAAYAAPTCSQLSALANNGSAPAAVFWWNDGGGSSDDYDYNDAYFAAQCTTQGGTGSGNTEVVLIQ